MMSAIANEATAARQPATVLARDLLKEGFAIEVDVPLEARRGQAEDEGRTIHFLQFGHKVGKEGGGFGYLNFFVHGESPEALEKYYGSTIVADAKLMKKSFQDGRAFMNVDLVPNDIAPTYRIFVLFNNSAKSKEAIPYSEVDWERFDTPIPLIGAVILVPLSATSLQTSTTTAPVAEKSETLPQKPTTDPQLNRLLAAGWKISSEDANEVKLAKGEKTMIHFKPRLKVKKKR